METPSWDQTWRLNTMSEISGLLSIMFSFYCIHRLFYRARRRGIRKENAMLYASYGAGIARQYKVDTCPHCGTTEMLCGFNGVGCTSERDKDGRTEELSKH